jgi:hypothetical protein
MTIDKADCKHLTVIYSNTPRYGRMWRCTMCEQTFHPTPQVNVHDDHEANCFCCTQCFIDYEEDLSDVTPGEGYDFRCHKGHFNSDSRYPDGQDIHSTIRKGRTCPDFEGHK